MLRRTDVTHYQQNRSPSLCIFNLEEAKKDLESINPKAKCKALSAQTGEGMEEWIDSIKEYYSQCLKR